MGEAMLLSGDAARAEQAAALIERALQLDPQAPKALFYGALIAFRQGRLDVARERFTAMLALSPPENVRAALQKEIDEIDAKQHPVLDAASAIHLHVTLAPALADKVPANASLFVFVRSPDGGPPLAASAVAVSLPQDVELSAADSMIAGRALQARPERVGGRAHFSLGQPAARERRSVWSDRLRGRQKRPARAAD